MIREANKYDKDQIIDMMKLFRAEADLQEYAGVENLAWWNTLLDQILAGQGVIYIDEGKGLFMAMILPTIWCNKTLAMHELAWYVKPSYRQTSIGYRLFSEYLKKAKELKQAGRIQFYTMSKLDNSQKLNFSKYGFRKKDENWIA